MWSTSGPLLSTQYYHMMTFWNFNTFWFVSLNTRRYQSRTFSGSCLNCPIRIPWFYLGENSIWGSHCEKGYHLLKECHGMSRPGWDGSLPNSTSDDAIAADCNQQLMRVRTEFEFSVLASRFSLSQRRWFRTDAQPHVISWNYVITIP
jgi:hypothetical protein